MRILWPLSELVHGHQSLDSFTVLAAALGFLLVWWRTFTVLPVQDVVTCTDLQLALLFSLVPYPCFEHSKDWLVRLKTHTFLFFNQTGNQISKSEVISQLEQGKELWTAAAGGLQGQSPGERQGPGLQGKTVSAGMLSPWRHQMKVWWRQGYIPKWKWGHWGIFLALLSFWAPIITIHIPDIFSPLGKKVLVDYTTLQLSHSDSCPDPAT